MVPPLPCRFYFAYCEAAFDAKYIRNYHILWVKDTSVPAPVIPAPLFSTGNAGGAIISSNPVTQVKACNSSWSSVAAAGVGLASSCTRL